MKMSRSLPLILIGIVMCFSCRKTNQQPIKTVDDKQFSLAAADHVPLQVVTIAGASNQPDYKDGKGANVRFSNPEGIDFGPDGSLYIADLFNDKIRKLTFPDSVSTINVPANSDGVTLKYPHRVLVSNDGTLTILANPILTFDPQPILWALRPNGQVLTPAKKTGYYTYNFYSDIVKDPFDGLMQICGLRAVTGHSGHIQSVVESLDITQPTIGQHSYAPPLDSLNARSRMSPTVGSMYYAYNGVKYLVIGGRVIYKLTPSGVFTQIYRDLVFNSITSIIATKDSKTLYLADQGRIESISNGKLHVLVGLNIYHQDPAGDGVGAAASVSAQSLALSKEESAIYFSDDNSTIRKLYLK
jgi:hypothetical protein